jgi:hypothetical protein
VKQQTVKIDMGNTPTFGVVNNEKSRSFWYDYSNRVNTDEEPDINAKKQKGKRKKAK